MQSKLHVTGMHCAGCESKIQKVLPRIKGVQNVNADREKESVAFDSDGEDATLIAVKEKIHELGYAVKD